MCNFASKETFLAYSKFLISALFSFLSLSLFNSASSSFYFYFYLCCFSFSLLVRSSSGTMTLVKCSTKPGYCKHRHSSILHSSSSKGKLLALIECETNLSSLSLFIPLSLLVLRSAVISLTILEGQEAFERSFRTYTLQGEIGLFRPQIHATILLSLQISV